MRVVKLHPDHPFPDEAAVVHFFTADLPNRNPPGLFHIHREIAQDGLDINERLLFIYRGRLRFVGLSASGRLVNTFNLQPAYPNCFIVAPGSIQPANASREQVEQALAAVGVVVNLASQGWNRVPDSPAVENAVQGLVQQTGHANDGSS
jgi:hypothetical protein